MNSMNSKLLFLPLKELQLYLTNLEIENEKLKAELRTFSRFNCILENIRRSSNKGFTAMQCIDRNKRCLCNEQFNGHLRRIAQESDIELRVWQEQYDKLVKSKKDFNISCEDDNSLSLSPLLPSPTIANTVSSTDELQIETDPELTMSLSPINNAKYGNNCDSINCFDNSSSPRNVSNVSGLNTDKSVKNFNFDNKNDESAIQYITLSPNADSDSRGDASPPIVVYDSKIDSKLTCDWPNCNQVFANEVNLMHHRRNHIRKSIYHCQFCSTRLLSKEELENHLKTHRISKTENIEDVEKDKSDQSNDAMVERTQAVNLVCSKAATDSNNDKSPSFQPTVFDNFRNHKTVRNDSTLDSLKSTAIRAEDYKRTRYSGVGRYRCPWPDCGYTPHFLRDLRRHMYKHTGDKKHKCDYPGCDFVSVWKTSLLQHQRKKHLQQPHLANTSKSSVQSVV